MLFSKIIKKKFDAVWCRYESDPAQYYFSAADFPELRSRSYDVKGSSGVLLKGYFYYYGEMNPEKFIIFDHGIGAGHNEYFVEIEHLAKNGYTVYAYDHTGCVETGGDGIRGFAQGINDLDCVLSAIKNDPLFAGKGIKLMGHSWGAYSAMNAAALHPEVTHVVSLAGFLSAESLIGQYMPEFVHKYIPEVMDRERENNPRYADMDSRESLMKSQAKFMHLQSKDDIKVKYELGYEPLYEALKDRKNTEFISVDGKNHDPHRTLAAAEAKREMLQELEALRKKHKLDDKSAQAEFIKAHDWKIICQQDEKIWDKILEFLDK